MIMPALALCRSVSQSLWMSALTRLSLGLISLLFSSAAPTSSLAPILPCFFISPVIAVCYCRRRFVIAFVFRLIALLGGARGSLHVHTAAVVESCMCACRRFPPVMCSCCPSVCPSRCACVSNVSAPFYLYLLLVIFFF